MKIVMRDGRVFQGTALQIVKAMQDIAFGVEDFTVPKYIEWVVANARKFEEVELAVKGETDEELAASLVAAPALPPVAGRAASPAALAAPAVPGAAALPSPLSLASPFSPPLALEPCLPSLASA
jgi:hypothetical protein